MSLLDSFAPAAADENEIFYLFFNRVPNSTIYFPDGSAAVFLAGRYATNDEAKATYLLQEIKKGNMYLYVDEKKFEVTAADLDPMAEYNARIIADYEAKKAAAANADAGTSSQGKLNVVSTATIGGAAVNSSSGTQGLTLALKAGTPATQLGAAGGTAAE